MYGASGISTAACTLATATHVHLHDDQCTCINSGRLQGDIRLTKLAALRGAKKMRPAGGLLTFDLVPDGDKHFILFFNYRYPFGRDRHRLTPFSFIKLSLVVLEKEKKRHI